MDEKTFNTELQELIRKIANLITDKQKQLASLVKKTKKQNRTIKININQISRSLASLQLCLKYLLLDLKQ